MAQKGVNTIIAETKGNILESVNNGLKQGLPISVVAILVENIMFEIDKSLTKTLEDESKEYQEQVQIENEQVLYEEHPQEV
jgi:hypothetical protein